MGRRGEARKGSQAPAGGVSSSARDMAHWVRLQLGNGKFDGKQAIGEDALAETRQPLIFAGPAPVMGGPSFMVWDGSCAMTRRGESA